MQERLRRHQGDPDQRAPAIVSQGYPGEFAVRHDTARTELDGAVVSDWWYVDAVRLEVTFQRDDYLLRLIGTSVREQPPRALRNVPPQRPDQDADQRPDEQREEPSQVDADDVRIEDEEEEVRARADHRAEPVRAVDRQVREAAVGRRDELVDGRIWSDDVAKRLSAIGHAADARVETRAKETPFGDFPAGFIDSVTVASLMAERLTVESNRTRIDRLGALDLVSQDLVVGVTAGLEKHRWMFATEQSGNAEG